MVKGIQGSGGEGDLCHLIAQTVHVGQPVRQGHLVDAVVAAPALQESAARHRTEGRRRLPWADAGTQFMSQFCMKASFGRL